MDSQKLSKKILYSTILILITILLLNSSTKDSFQIQKDMRFNELEGLNSSEVIPHMNILWNSNPQFEGTGEPWYSSIEGDNTDLDTSISNNQANYGVLGEIRNFSEISGIPQEADWNEIKHSIRPFPLTHNFTKYGLNVSHVYDEDDTGPFPNSGDQTANLAGVLWKRNVTLPVDMSEYIITSASISALVNGSGDTDLETPNDHPPFAEGGYASLFDFTRFYIEISDLNNLEPYEIAYFKTIDLGEAYAGRRDYDYSTRNFMNDTYMITIDEDVLIFALNQVLKHDDHNFTVTLGIDIDCEDNYPGYELDVWYSLLIKSCDLHFTYIKKMNKETSASWIQIGNNINGTNVKITDANLKFKYKIDQSWPTALSPNSEIRILINSRQHSETIKLSSATTTFNEAKIDGFDLIDIIYPYENVTISIQVFLADEFGLNQSIVVSITDVYLYISYIETIPDVILEPWIFTTLLVIASIITTGVGGYLIAYQKILKYPRPVRKVRKFRRTLGRKQSPNVLILDRERAFRRIYSREVSGIIKLHKTKALESPLEKKLESEPSENRMESEQLITESIEKKTEIDKLVKESLKESLKEE